MVCKVSQEGECNICLGVECKVCQGVECKVCQGVECKVSRGVECKLFQGVECRVTQGVKCKVCHRWSVIYSLTCIHFHVSLNPLLRRFVLVNQRLNIIKLLWPEV